MNDFLNLFNVIIIPVVSIVAGFMMKNKPPKEINNTIGYRTKRSKASREAWDFANSYCGKNTFVFGIISLILGIVAYYLFCKGKGVIEGVISAIIIMTIQVIIMVIVMVVPTEVQLKKRFEKSQ